MNRPTGSTIIVYYQLFKQVTA